MDPAISIPSFVFKEYTNNFMAQILIFIFCCKILYLIVVTTP